MQLGKLTEAESALLPDNDAMRVRGVQPRCCSRYACGAPLLLWRARSVGAACTQECFSQAVPSYCLPNRLSPALPMPRTSRCPTVVRASTCWAASTSCPTGTAPPSPTTAPRCRQTLCCGAHLRSCAHWVLTTRRSSSWRWAAASAARPPQPRRACLAAMARGLAPRQVQRQPAQQPGWAPQAPASHPWPRPRWLRRTSAPARPAAQHPCPLRPPRQGWAPCSAGWTAGGSAAAIEGQRCVLGWA